MDTPAPPVPAPPGPARETEQELSWTAIILGSLFWLTLLVGTLWWSFATDLRLGLSLVGLYVLTVVATVFRALQWIPNTMVYIAILFVVSLQFGATCIHVWMIKSRSWECPCMMDIPYTPPHLVETQERQVGQVPTEQH